MGMLMICCPKTGRAISTGRHIESRFFSSTPVFFSSTYCPHCRVRHEWFVKDAWVSDSNSSECEFLGWATTLYARCEMAQPGTVAIHGEWGS
jgi:hypothetical protein